MQVRRRVSVREAVCGTIREPSKPSNDVARHAAFVCSRYDMQGRCERER